MPGLTRRVVARFAAGPAWKSGPPQAQPRWDEHERWIEDLAARGLVVMGGPFSDHSGALVLFEGLAEDDVRELLATDSFVENGVFAVEDVREWTIFVDRLA